MRLDDLTTPVEWHTDFDCFLNYNLTFVEQVSLIHGFSTIVVTMALVLGWINQH